MEQSNSKQKVHQNFGVGGSHSRSISQPTFFANNCLPPLSPLPHSDSSLASNSSLKDLSMDGMDVSSRGPLPAFVSPFAMENVFRVNESIPPRKGHRRSISDTVPLAFSAMIQSSPQLVPISGQGGFGGMKDKPNLLQRRELDMKNGGKSNAEGEVVDEMLNSFMNLDNVDAWNSSVGEDKDNVTIASVGESSNIETESTLRKNNSIVHGTSLREGVKRSAIGDIAPTARHYRSLSIDSAFGCLNFSDDSPKPPSLVGNLVGQFSRSNSVTEKPAGLNLEFGSSDFSEAELKKIMADERLAEVAISDPKRAKRILANRQSAARSKERKLRYISELEHKVQTLQTETTTLSTQITVMQKDFTELTNQNNELKFRLEAMQQQAKLRDALHEALTAEVQRLKLVKQEHKDAARPSNCIPQQISPNHRMFQMQQRQQPNQRHQLSVAASKTTATGSTTPASA